MSPVQYGVQGGTARTIAESLEAAVRSGSLRPGEALPTVRALAGDLRVAPGTVAAAYRALRDRGLVETRGRGGTVVRPRPALAVRGGALPTAAGVVDLAGGQPSPALLPALDLDLLRGLTGPAASPAGLVLPELADLAGSRLATDGVPAGALTVAGGGLDAIARLLGAGLAPGDAVAVEDPGWPNLLDLVAALGLRPRPVAVDDAGPRPDALRAALRSGAAAAVVTSRAHNPTGGYVSAARAAGLRDVLADFPRTLVIEDDHAAELAGVELAPLAGVTASWAFVRSLSKPYGPDLRLAVVAGDEATIARVEGRTRASSGWVSSLLQRAAVQLWTRPDVADTVACAGRAYDTRRALLLRSLARHGVPATGATGLNVWVPVADETATVAALLQAGWAVAPGSRFRSATPPGVRVTVSALDEDRVEEFGDALVGAVTGRAATAPSS